MKSTERFRAEGGAKRHQAAHSFLGVCVCVCVCVCVRACARAPPLTTKLCCKNLCCASRFCIGGSGVVGSRFEHVLEGAMQHMPVQGASAQELSGDPNTEDFLKSTAIQVGGMRLCKWGAYCCANGGRTAVQMGGVGLRVPFSKA